MSSMRLEKKIKNIRIAETEERVEEMQTIHQRQSKKQNIKETLRVPAEDRC